MRRYYDVGYDLWCCSGVSITACDSTLGCQSRFVTLPWPVGYGLWRCPRMSVTVFDAVSVTGSRSPSVKVCDGVTESVGHGLWVGVGEFTNYHHSTLFFPAKCKTWYFFKNVSTLGTLLLLGVLNIKNSSSLLFSLSFFLHYSFLPLLLRSHLFQNRNLEYPRWVKFNHDTYNSLNR